MWIEIEEWIEYTVTEFLGHLFKMTDSLSILYLAKQSIPNGEFYESFCTPFFHLCLFPSFRCKKDTEIKWKNTEGFCIIQVDDNGFCKPVTHNHKWSMYLFTSMQFIMGIYIFFLVTNKINSRKIFSESYQWFGEFWTSLDEMTSLDKFGTSLVKIDDFSKFVKSWRFLAYFDLYNLICPF